MTSTARKVVGTWLLIGCAMVFFQVIVGGVTRLTESGLSITEWKPVKGIVPPLNETEWQAEFALYQNITQYKTINEGMTLNEFKWIYFWEYFHRFWARFMGLVFIIPFSFFVWKKWFSPATMRQIGILFLWGGLIGLYGWIMVRSGLTGIYVPPVHLSIHLILALSLFAYLVYMTLTVWRSERAQPLAVSPALYYGMYILLALLFIQIFLGGIVSGMKAGLAYPTWPDMNGEWVPSALFNLPASVQGFVTYNAQDFWGRTLIQFVHRSTAYVLVMATVWLYLKLAAKKPADVWLRNGLPLLPLATLLQAAIGIITVMNCTGKIPVFYGVLHQAGAMVLIAVVVFVIYHLKLTSAKIAE